MQVWLVPPATCPGVGIGEWEGHQGGIFMGGNSGRGSLVTPAGPWSLSANSTRRRRRPKMTSSSSGGRSSSVGRHAESKSSTTPTHSSLGRPYTPSLPDDSSDIEFLCEDSTDSHPNSLPELDTPARRWERVFITHLALRFSRQTVI